MKKIAVSLAEFEELIREDYIYVDKTKFLYEIIRKDKYYFLPKPRRFGKTLFLNTLKAFFEGKRDLFNGLYIDTQEIDWKEHPILKIDFSEIENRTTEILKVELEELLFKNAALHGITLQARQISSRFNELVREIYNRYKKGVVILIDEYDKPMVDHIGQSAEELDIAKSNQMFLKNLYDNLKPLEPYVRLVFITGVSKFSKVSIFSTLNNLVELDLHSRFSTILGYTEEEVRRYFSEHIKDFARELSITESDLINQFKMYYDGFRFGRKESRVYNPFSLAKALDYREIDNYWFESGTPTYLVNLISEKNYDITALDSIVVHRDQIKAYDIERIQVIPILFQTGYLTIKEIEDHSIYTLGYPNYEVEKGFTLNLIQSISHESIQAPTIHRIKKSLMNKDYDRFMESMSSLFAAISYVNIPKGVREKEHFYHTIFYLVGVLCSDSHLGVYSELLTSLGRIDMLVETDETIFLLEFKCNQSAIVALEQIRDRKYKDRFLIKEKEIVLIGINFDTERRTIGEYLIE